MDNSELKEEIKNYKEPKTDLTALRKKFLNLEKTNPELYNEITKAVKLMADEKIIEHKAADLKSDSFATRLQAAITAEEEKILKNSIPAATEAISVAKGSPAYLMRNFNISMEELAWYKKEFNKVYQHYWSLVPINTARLDDLSKVDHAPNFNKYYYVKDNCVNLLTNLGALASDNYPSIIENDKDGNLINISWVIKPDIIRGQTAQKTKTINLEKFIFDEKLTKIISKFQMLAGQANKLSRDYPENREYEEIAKLFIGQLDFLQKLKEEVKFIDSLVLSHFQLLESKDNLYKFYKKKVDLFVIGEQKSKSFADETTFEKIKEVCEIFSVDWKNLQDQVDKQIEAQPYYKTMGGELRTLINQDVFINSLRAVLCEQTLVPILEKKGHTRSECYEILSKGKEYFIMNKADPSYTTNRISVKPLQSAEVGIDADHGVLKVGNVKAAGTATNSLYLNGLSGVYYGGELYPTTVTTAAHVYPLVDLNQPKQEINKEMTVKAVANSFLKTLESDGKEAAKRTAARKLTKLAQDLLVGLMTSGVKGKAANSMKDTIRNNLNTDEGKALLGITIGGLLPQFKQMLPEKYHSLMEEMAKEFRVEGISVVGGIVTDFITGPAFMMLQSSVTDVFDDLSKETAPQVRVSLTAPDADSKLESETAQREAASKPAVARR